MTDFDSPIKPLSDDPELTELIERAREYVKSLTPEQYQAMVQAQKESWVRGEMAMGETSVTINPQPSLDYDAGFRAGIEAAARLCDRNAAHAEDEKRPRERDTARDYARVIRNLKPEPPQ